MERKSELTEILRSLLAAANDRPDAAAKLERALELVDETPTERAQQLVADVGEALGSRLDFHVTIPEVAALILARLADACAIVLVDEHGALDTLALVHRDPVKQSKMAASRGVFPLRDPRHRSHEPQCDAETSLVTDIDDAFRVAIATSDEQLAELRDLDTASQIVVPLFAAGRVLGSFGVGRTRGRPPFDARDVKLVEAIAHRVTTAIDNSLLFGVAQQANRRLMALQEVTEAALSLRSIDALCQSAASGVRSVFHADTAAILLADGQQRVRVIACDGNAGPFERELDVPITRGVAGTALSTGKTQVVEDPRDIEVAQPFLREAEIRTLLVAPLRGDTQKLGVLHVGTRERRSYSDDDLRLLQLIADRIAVGVEHHRLLASERAARADAEAANRMKDEFLATMSHELRTPLNAIVGWTALMRTAPPDGPLARKALVTIDRNAKTQARLIEDLLDVSRIISGKLNLVLGETDLRGVTLAALDAVRPAADSRNIALQEDLQSVDDILADGDRLQQVVWNLVSNAVKFTPKGGVVEVKLDRHGSDVRLVVQDTGEGIPVDVLPFVFERFRQADSSMTRRHGGLGLGLAIVRHLVELHGGSVTAESLGPGRGSQFTVILPVRAVQVVASPIRVPETPPAIEYPQVSLLHGVRVLAVDDDADARELLTAVLSRAGADVTTAASSGAALEVVPSFRPDVIVCDVGMPHEDGYQFVRKLRGFDVEHGGGTPAIALTAYARVDDVRAAMEAGFQQHLAKPVDPARIVTSVAAAARRG